MPVESEVRSLFGPSGLGEVRFLKESVKVIANSGDVYTLAGDAHGEFIPRKNQKNCYFMLSEDETKLVVVRPWDGNHIWQFGGFRKNQDGVPKINIKAAGWRTFRTGGRKWVPERPQFTAYLAITDGQYEGYGISLTMDYIFVPGTGGSAKLSAKSARVVSRVENFLDLCGFNRMNEDIPFSENVLPPLEAILLARAPKHRALVLMKEGWAETLSRLPTGM